MFVEVDENAERASSSFNSKSLSIDKNESSASTKKIGHIHDLLVDKNNLAVLQNAEDIQ